MLSSTFQDLRDLRGIASEALEHAKFFVDRMEVDGARPGWDVIDSSLQKVNEAHGYVLLLGRRYGEPPVCPTRNPNLLSTTHLEFNRAKKRGIPIAVISLSDAYPLPAYEENDATRAKRDTLRREAKALGIYAEVKSLDEFCLNAPKAAFALRDEIKKHMRPTRSARRPAIRAARAATDLRPPAAPAYYEVKPFAQGMDFVGRDDDLEAITDWARGEDPMLVIEAMGGMGKSMLTHHWTTICAPLEETKFAGRMWYSFYQDGADLADFCRHALAYVEGRPPGAYAELSRSTLADHLIRRLQERPWLIVMDGLERVLQAYASFGHAGLRLEAIAASTPESGLSATAEANGQKPDPNLCMRPEDDNLLRDLARVAPSKLLVSTRNMPSALLSEAHRPRKGVKLNTLRGLAGKDALLLMRQAGVRGDAASIVGYLERHFGCHPLMIGIVAGLVNDHPPSPGDFDNWLQHPHGAHDLDLSKIDGLVGKREHVLKVAFDGLGADERTLLTSLALFSDAKDYSVLETVAAHFLAGQETNRSVAPTIRNRETWLSTAVIDLRRRGLVIAGAETATYDLHPLVRAFVRDSKGRDERKRAGDAVVDYALSRAPAVIDDRSTRDELDRYLAAAEALLLAENPTEAATLLSEGLAHQAVRYGRGKTLYGLLTPLFESGLTAFKPNVPDDAKSTLSNQIGVLTSAIGPRTESRNAHLLSLKWDIANHAPLEDFVTVLCNLCDSERTLGQIANAARIIDLAGSIADLIASEFYISNVAHFRVRTHASRGDLNWKTYAPEACLDEPGDFKGSFELKAIAIVWRLRILRWQRKLTHQDIDAMLVAKAVNDHMWPLLYIRDVQAGWLQERGAHSDAASAFEIAIAIGRRSDMPVEGLEARYAASLAALGHSEDARAICVRLADAREPDHLSLAQAWLALGETERARAAALTAYPKAWADGPPYALHWKLEECRAILRTVGEPEPRLPSTRPEDLPPLGFEAEINRMIAERKARRP